MAPQGEMYHLQDPKFPGRRPRDFRRYFTRAGFPDYMINDTSSSQGIDCSFGGRDNVSGNIGYSQKTGKILLTVQPAKGRTPEQQDAVTALLLSFAKFNPKKVDPKKPAEVKK